MVLTESYREHKPPQRRVSHVNLKDNKIAVARIQKDSDRESCEVFMGSNADMNEQ